MIKKSYRDYTLDITKTLGDKYNGFDINAQLWGRVKKLATI